MSLWGNLDASNNAPVFWAAGGFTANVSANASVAANASNAQIAGIFGNTTIGFWREGVVDGIFGIDAIEANSQFSTGDGRYVTHAGWVNRVVGTGPVLTLTANAGATGVNSFIIFSGGSSGAAAGMTGNTSANAIVYVNSTFHIVNVTIVTGGSYSNTPFANANTGNAVYTVTMGGRANRVQQETLVAMGSMTGDATASDDANYPDS
jgi:hypothetical protein